MKEQKAFQEDTKPLLFREGENCRAHVVASHASMLVDCANYYRALHQSLSKAQHTIFITGWDIDSRIELIRREEDGAHEGVPRTLYDLLTQKAAENPSLKIYLNRWDYAFFMASMREPMAVWKWKGALLPNIYYCRDNMTPMWACHHQKVVVVDDEVAFVGGMDVALNRWDDRCHSPHKHQRVDPGGVYNPSCHKHFAPYHDIQMVVAGDAARVLAELSRERWKTGAGYDAAPLRKPDGAGLPQSWPHGDPPDFKDIPMAVAITSPAYAGRPGEYTIERLYLDQIAAAQKFIYIENQYLARDKIAIALRRRLEENRDLRALIVSSYDPQGWMEKISMWTARVRFQKILNNSSVRNRVAFAYPLCHEKGKSATIRIHSKMMIVDDRFIHIGSANINNRSMRMDTECDLCFEGVTGAHRTKIESIRNDLIREHTGFEAEQVQRAVDSGEAPSLFLKRLPHSTQHLVKIDDKRFFKKGLPDISLDIADPKMHVMPELLVPPANDVPMRVATRRKIIGMVALFLFLAVSAALWQAGIIEKYSAEEGLFGWFGAVRSSALDIPAAIALYAVCALFFVPVTILTAVSALMFGYGKGFFVAFTGALLSSLVSYGIAKMAGEDKIIFLTRTASEKIKSFARKANITSVTFLRLIPIAPFTAVNLALGMGGVRPDAYIAGTAFGLLPGMIVIVFLSNTLANLWVNPGLENILFAGASIAAWLALVWGVHILHRRWIAREKQPDSAAA